MNKASQKDEKIIELSDSIEESRKKQEQQQGEISKHIEFLEKKNAEIEKTRTRVCQFAEKKTKPGFILKWYIFPFITFVLVLVYIYFIISQFFFCDKPWNFANIVFSFIANTTFGKSVNDYYVQVDAAAFILLSAVIIPLFWVKPWDIDKKEADKQNRIEQYIKKNHLL